MQSTITQSFPIQKQDWKDLKIDAFEINQGINYPLFSQQAPLLSTGKSFFIKFSFTYGEALSPTIQQIVQLVKQSFEVYSHHYDPLKESWTTCLDNDSKEKIISKCNQNSFLIKYNNIFAKLENISFGNDSSFTTNSTFYSFYLFQQLLVKDLVFLNQNYYKLILKGGKEVTWKSLTDRIQGVEWLHTYISKLRASPDQFECSLRNISDRFSFSIFKFREEEKCFFTVLLQCKSQEIYASLQNNLSILKDRFKLSERSKSEEEEVKQINATQDKVVMLFQAKFLAATDLNIQLDLIFYLNRLGDQGKRYTLSFLDKKIAHFAFVPQIGVCYLENLENAYGDANWSEILIHRGLLNNDNNPSSHLAAYDESHSFSSYAKENLWWSEFNLPNFET